MKLVFPNGEHGQVLLNLGPNRIGSSPEGAAVLTQAGIQPVHCEIHVTQTGANLQVPANGGPVTVNNKPVTDLMALRAGDSIGIGPVVAKFAIVEAVRRPSAAGPMMSPDEDSGATRVRAAIPKYMLRGVSGAVFSKVYPVSGPTVIGRAAECDIPVAADEISRRHAIVKPTPDGVSVEDLGSSNGTFINGKRVQQGFLNPGDELRLDAVRFVLVAPGLEMGAASGGKTANNTPVPVSRSSGDPQKQMMQWALIMITVAALLMIGLMILRR
jgi:pSer/pThr/pTyr-binding forkhead associated (FHA) protein